MHKVKWHTIAGYLSPTALMVLLISSFPILYTIYYSFTNFDNGKHNLPPSAICGVGDNTCYRYVGFQNYNTLLQNVFQGGDFLQVMAQTLLYVVVCVSLFLVIGMVTALALNNPKIKGLPIWRALLILPWAVPSVITALIWAFLYDETFGPFNQILRIFFGAKAGIPWLTNPVMAFIAVVLVNVWLTFPFFTVLILGALQSVPAELNEAAAVDGANGWQRFRNVTLPLLVPAITPATILSGITTFQMFNTVYLITMGGPGKTALRPGYTTFIMIYAYTKNALNSPPNPYGLTSALAVIIFIILLALTIFALRFSNVAKETAR